MLISNIDWYIQLVILLLALVISFFLMYQVDFHRFMRPTRARYASVLYIVLSLVVGFALGLLLIYLASLFAGLKPT